MSFQIVSSVSAFKHTFVCANKKIKKRLFPTLKSASEFLRFIHIQNNHEERWSQTGQTLLRAFVSFYRFSAFESFHRVLLHTYSDNRGEYREKLFSVMRRRVGWQHTDDRSV